MITVDPEVLGGTPVFTGTRVPVESLIDHLAAGDTLDDFLEGFPGVGREQAEAFLRERGTGRSASPNSCDGIARPCSGRGDHVQ